MLNGEGGEAETGAPTGKYLSTDRWKPSTMTVSGLELAEGGEAGRVLDRLQRLAEDVEAVGVARVLEGAVPLRIDGLQRCRHAPVGVRVAHAALLGAHQDEGEALLLEHR